MDIWVWIAIVSVLVVIVAIAAWAMGARRRTEGLRRQFGPEYEATVERAESRRAAEGELQARRERREHLSIGSLSEGSRERYATSWREVQARFVDEPAEALRAADVLVTELMQERGYPMADFDQRAADISVDHPQVVRDYRIARAISEETSMGGADTERMREGLVHYRALFAELLEDGGRTERGEATG